MTRSWEVPPIRLTLFISSHSVASTGAVANIGRALAVYPPNAFSLEIIDAFSDPARLLRENIFITPTLVAPDLARRVVGELSAAGQLELFLRALLACSEADE